MKDKPNMIKKTMLVMSYEDGSGAPSVCPYILSDREAAIARWIIDHAGETRVEFVVAEEREMK